MDLDERARVEPPALQRPRGAPLPESAAEVSQWASREDSRRVELIYAPVFWVLLPVAALAFLVHQTVTDPTGAGWNITINGESRDTWPAWMPWLAWIGVSAWLLVAIGVLLFRLSLWQYLRTENAWIFERGIPHSLHRSSMDYDDGESRWATYIALDHRLGDDQAGRIHAVFERWLAQVGRPPSRSAPISSASLFGAPATGGYFLLRSPVSVTAGDTAPHPWVLITEPREDSGEVIVTPVPVSKKLAKIRRGSAKGQRVRFLHNTHDPDDLDDILLLEDIDDAVQRPDEETSRIRDAAQAAMGHARA